MLKKLLFITIILLNFLHAEDKFSSEKFLGIEVGYGAIKRTSLIEKSTTDRGVELGLRFGAENKEWRTTISSHYFSKKGQSYFKTMLEFDRFVWSSLYEIDNIIFKPYMGAHIGWVHYSDELDQTSDGFIYGAQAGITWNVLNEVDFDFGYRYSLSDISHVDNIGGLVFGVNYLY